MIGLVLARAVTIVLGYAYPAYQCYKTVEMNKPQVEQLRFWCQYWILIAMLTVFERIADVFLFWLPFYCEAKVAFILYLWYTKTHGTTYVYDTFFRSYLVKHEKEIDRNLLELKTRSADYLVLCLRSAWSYGQTGIVEVMQYVNLQAQSFRIQPVQVQTPQQIHPAPASSPVLRPAASHQTPSSPVLRPAVSHQTPGSPKRSPPMPEATRSPPMPEATPKHLETEEAAHIKAESLQATDEANHDLNAQQQDTVADETVHLARRRLRRVGTALTGPSPH